MGGSRGWGVMRGKKINQVGKPLTLEGKGQESHGVVWVPGEQWVPSTHSENGRGTWEVRHREVAFRTGRFGAFEGEFGAQLNPQARPSLHPCTSVYENFLGVEFPLYRNRICQRHLGRAGM